MTRRGFDRNQRLEEEIRRVLTELLVHQAKDPRLEGVTVSGVKLSAERSIAQVYFSVLGDDERERQASDGLTAAAAFLRREMGRRMRLRTVPELRFERDPSFAYGDRMERLLDSLRLSDGDEPEGDA